MMYRILRFFVNLPLVIALSLMTTCRRFLYLEITHLMVLFNALVSGAMLLLELSVLRFLMIFYTAAGL